MNQTLEGIDSLTLNITDEIHVQASLEATFAAILEEMGPYNRGGEGQPMPMKLEAWPGGRWYRDLGGENGHFWGQVQAIKRPSLLEITGPLFMSSAVVSNVQYRLSEKAGGTLIQFRHTAFGVIEERYRANAPNGWRGLQVRIQRRAEAGR
jgi:uncharacterized protein YndB with AHSA1/START domain